VVVVVVVVVGGRLTLPGIKYPLDMKKSIKNYQIRVRDSDHNNNG
jgi:hypothetical protein